MIRAAGLLVLLSSVATAEPLTLSGRLDDTIVETARCDDGLQVTARLRLSSHDVRELHECGSSDLTSRLALHTEDGWRVFNGELISYAGANMTDAPLHITLLAEHDAFATLAGQRVWLHRTDTRHRNIRMDGTVDEERRVRRIDVCRYLDGEPVCGFASVTCGNTCPVPRVRDGALWLGAQRFTLD